MADYIGVPYIPLSDSNYYIVQKGDTLWNIARKYNISVNDLKVANNLTNNSLSIGQSLFIPNQEIEDIEPSGEVYKVQSGDTLYSIARKFNTTVNKIKQLNNLNSNTLSIGQSLIINESGNLNDFNDKTQYIVQSGDNLYAIARKYNVTVDAIKSANNLSSNLLSIGQILIIPLPSIESSTNTHTVVSGDTLYGLAQKYNVSVDNLKAINNLNNNNLSIGQVLVIPSSTSYITYTVKPGDSLYSISRTYGTTVSEIESLNNLSSNILQVGQQLLLPNK